MRDGGYLVRARVTATTTGRMVEIRKSLSMATLTQAAAWLDEQRAIARAGESAASKPSARFSEYAALLFERKVAAGDIRSAAGKNKWVHVLEHLIVGTRGVEGFGEYYVDQIGVSHVERWRSNIGKLIKSGAYSPNTANTWVGVLKTIMSQAKREFGLRCDPTEGMRTFDASEHETYSDEHENAIPPDRVGELLAIVQERWPQHYAMIYLGLVTGLRPSSLRPLRWRGEESDVDWERHRLRVRRSHTVGDDVMRTTKQRRRYTIGLPEDAIRVLHTHVHTQMVTEEQKASDLLFPSETGGFRSTSVLVKPFADISEAMGLELTPRSLRRTFQDLCRAAQVGDIVTRSISGHATQAMQARYSSVAADEQRDALGKVVSLFGRPGPGGMHGGMHRGAGGVHWKEGVSKVS